jgi:S1-C subfamily serine protease
VTPAYGSRLPRPGCFALAAVVLAALLAGGVAIEAWLAEDGLRADLEGAVRRVRERSDADGYDAIRIGAPVLGAAAAGERLAFPLGLRGARQLAVVAACDGRCGDLALRILDRSGNEVARDASGDAVPVVSTKLDDAAGSELEITLRGCDAKQCRYAFQLMEIASREGDGDDGSTGTCFAIGPDGLLLTARHVIAGAREIDVRFPGSAVFAATVVGADEAEDVALLRIQRPTHDYLPLAQPGAVRLGEPVFTVGFPAVDVLGDAPKYSDGTVGALSGLENDPPSLQLSVPVQPGSSGGPVVNDRGEVV